MQAPNGLAAVQAAFGNPANGDGTLNQAWAAANIRRVAPPDGWHLYYQQTQSHLVSVSAISMHGLVEPMFLAAMRDIWQAARQQLNPAASDDAVRVWLHQQRLDITGGGFNFRHITGGATLSMHAFGIAIDWDPLHNPRGNPLRRTLPDWWYQIWANQGWSDGRHFNTPDPMHVQFATGC